MILMFKKACRPAILDSEVIPKDILENIPIKTWLRLKNKQKHPGKTLIDTNSSHGIFLMLKAKKENPMLKTLGKYFRYQYQKKDGHPQRL